MQINNQELNQFRLIEDHKEKRKLELSEEKYIHLDKRIEQAFKGAYTTRLMHTDKARSEMINWLSSDSPRYAITLTYSTSTSQSISRKLLSEFCYKLNCMILGGAYRRGNDQLPIFAVREVAESQRKNMGKDWLKCDHYHLIIKNPKRDIKFDLTKFRSIVLKAVKFANKSIKGNRFKILDGGNIDIQDYYNDGSDEWENYITKVYEDFTLSNQKMSDHIGWFDAETKTMVFGELEF